MPGFAHHWCLPRPANGVLKSALMPHLNAKEVHFLSPASMKLMKGDYWITFCPFSICLSGPFGSNNLKSYGWNLMTDVAITNTVQEQPSPKAGDT